MRRVRMVGLCLVAVLAVAGVASASASAVLPEWGGCEAKAEGRYEDAACTVVTHHRRTNGHYEWYTGAAFAEGYGVEGYRFFPVIGPTSFETTGGKTIACSGGNGESRIELGNAPNEVKEILLTFTGCESEGRECASPQQLEGPGGITNYQQWGNEEALRGKLVFVAGRGTGSPTVGLTLESFDNKSETAEQRRLLTAICQGAIETVWLGQGRKGGNRLISLITPVDEMTTDFTQTFSESAPGIQSPSTAEHGPERYLQEFLNHKWERSAWVSSFEDISEEEAPPIEIKARP